MNSPKVKICGISNIEILKTLISLDLDFIGFIFYSKSPRYIDTKFLQSIEDLDLFETLTFSKLASKYPPCFANSPISVPG